MKKWEWKTKKYNLKYKCGKKIRETLKVRRDSNGKTEKVRNKREDGEKNENYVQLLLHL
jgi:hypothetical protein